LPGRARPEARQSRPRCGAPPAIEPVRVPIDLWQAGGRPDGRAVSAPEREIP
jgi:hypothetical protein